jgi:hypothetical protein
MLKLSRRILNVQKINEKTSELIQHKKLKATVREFFAQRNRATATKLVTDEWATINQQLIGQQWRKLWEFRAFDKGIEYDLIIFQKNGSTNCRDMIISGWMPTSEGEIQFCSDNLNLMENLIPKMDFGDPVSTVETTVRLVAGLY